MSEKHTLVCLANCISWYNQMNLFPITKSSTFSINYMNLKHK